MTPVKVPAHMRKLTKRLLQVGGGRVAYRPGEWSKSAVARFLADCFTAAPAQVSLVRGKRNNCHADALRYAMQRPDTHQLYLGFYLIPGDECWRTHSWVCTNDGAVVSDSCAGNRTAAQDRKYVGVGITSMEQAVALGLFTTEELAAAGVVV